MGCGQGTTQVPPWQQCGGSQETPQAQTAHLAPSLPSSLLHLGLGPVLLTHLPCADPLAGDTQVGGRLWLPRCGRGEETAGPLTQGLVGKPWGWRGE